MAEDVSLVIDGAAMEWLLKGPDGPVVRHLTKILDETIVVARTKITRRFTGPLNAGAGGATLENALVKRFVINTAGPDGFIAAEKYYAAWVHDGNDPGGGWIYPKRAKFLRFVEPGGGFVFARRVRASKPNPFLRDALEEVMAFNR